MSATGVFGRLAAALCTIMLAIGVVACGGDDDATTSAAPGQGAKEKVTIAVSTPIAALLPPYLAEAQGLFDKEGIDATVKTIAPPQNLAVVASGQAQFAIGGAPQLDLAAAKAPIKIIGTWATKVDSQFITQPEIDSPSQLRGKTIAVAPKGTQSWVLTQRWLQSAGMSMEDVKLTSAPSFSVAIAQFSQGQLAGLFSSPPQTDLLLQQRKGAKVLHQFDDTWTSGQIVANGPWAENHPDATEAVLRALDGAVKAWLADPAAAKAVIAEQAGIKDPEQLDAAFASTKKIFTNGVTAVTSAHEATLLSLIKEAGLETPDPATADKLLDTSYVKAIGGTQ